LKPIKVENEEIKRAICSGDSYIQIGDRKFLLFEVDQIKNPNIYEVVDHDEEEQLLSALEDENPVLSEEEIKRMLGDQK
jgi:hypothetical protein